MPTATSADGTRIAYDRAGSGPAVILIGGATATRGLNVPLTEALSEHFTVLNYDRRGRGDSDDRSAPSAFDVERELEDLAALIEAGGGVAHLFGISSGGALALEAASAGLPVAKVAVYEVPYNLAPEQPGIHREYVRTLGGQLAEGRQGDMMATFLRTVGAPDEAVEQMRQSPMWPAFEAVAPTLLYDAAALGTGQPDPARLAQIKAPLRVITGLPGDEHEVGGVEFFESAARAIVAAVPGSDHVRLPGQTHDVAAEAIAPLLVDFYTR
ncbi:alpha/beta hydrolase [Nonomuraea longicatena]|uniref:Alpha/beta hydrolase n=1 Tax=Nonomuraea longicatena TaxID=83682 RepID=A0ABN1QFV8_9ACTN